MTNDRKFCKCDLCGNFISFIHNAGVPVMCCGKKMTELTPNTTDAAVEKHVPVAVHEECDLTVTVGSVAHPMTEEHLIEWIVVADGERTQRIALAAGQEPKAEFCLCGENATVYAYCNLHGLWETKI